MNYDNIIIELLNRIKVLEEKVKKLEEISLNSKKPTTADIKQHIIENLEKISADDFIILKSGDIHKQLKLKNSMPMVCNAMYACMDGGDEILERTASGYSSTLTIKFHGKK